jgi:putative membrane protein
MADERASAKPPTPGEPQVRLASERTLLAWVRTGLGLMGFGFVVARFGLFLRELESAQQIPVHPSTGLSLPIGVALVVLGVAATLLGAWQHARRLSRLDRGEPFPRPLWYWGVIVAVLLALVGVVLVAYLIGVGH